jgi:hypothetical protein
MHSALRPLGKEQRDRKERSFQGMWIWRSTVFSVELAMVLTLAVEVASAALGANGELLTYARNHALNRGY